jgi:hypothetical protein
MTQPEGGIDNTLASAFAQIRAQVAGSQVKDAADPEPALPPDAEAAQASKLVNDNQFRSLVARLSAVYTAALASHDRVITSANAEAQAALANLDSRQRVKTGEIEVAGPSAAESATERMAREARAICQDARLLLEKAGEEYTSPTPDADGAPDSAATAFADVVLGIEDLRFRLVGLRQGAADR